MKYSLYQHYRVARYFTIHNHETNTGWHSPDILEAIHVTSTPRSWYASSSDQPLLAEFDSYEQLQLSHPELFI